LACSTAAVQPGGGLADRFDFFPAGDRPDGFDFVEVADKMRKGFLRVLGGESLEPFFIRIVLTVLRILPTCYL
jgi:hypothetical protein